MPVLCVLIAGFLTASAIAFRALKRVRFTDDAITLHKAEWLPTEFMQQLNDTGLASSGAESPSSSCQLSTSEQLKNDILRTQSYLSPSLIGAIVGKSSAQEARRRLIRAYADLQADEIANLFAVAFLKNPGDALVAGVSVTVEAR
eukprot:162843-Prymnesium_polylepis.1